MKTKRIKAFSAPVMGSGDGSLLFGLYQSDVPQLIEQMYNDMTEHWSLFYATTTQKDGMTYALKRAGIRAGRKGKK